MNQFVAEFIFKRGNLFADRRLTNSPFLCNSGEATPPCSLRISYRSKVTSRPQEVVKRNETPSASLRQARLSAGVVQSIGTSGNGGEKSYLCYARKQSGRAYQSLKKGDHHGRRI